MVARNDRLAQDQLLDEAHGAVVGDEEGIGREPGVHFADKFFLLEGELVAVDGRGEGYVELAASEEALQGEGTGARADVPGLENALGVEAGGYFHLFDVGRYDLVH